MVGFLLGVDPQPQQVGPAVMPTGIDKVPTRHNDILVQIGIHDALLRWGQRLRQPASIRADDCGRASPNRIPRRSQLHRLRAARTQNRSGVQNESCRLERKDLRRAQSTLTSQIIRMPRNDRNVPSADIPQSEPPPKWGCRGGHVDTWISSP